MTNTEDITRQEAVEKLGGAEVTGDALDDLFERVDSGELSIDEANRLLEEAGTEDMEGAGDAGQDESFENNIPEAADQRGASQGNDQAQGSTKPFRVFDTQEDYQRTFDNAWNKRYGKMMHEQEARSAEHNALLSDLGALLGVAPEQAAGELNRRRLLLEAQQQGNESPETYAALKTVEQERDNLKQQMETQEPAPLWTTSEDGAQRLEKPTRRLMWSRPWRIQNLQTWC